MPQKRTDFSFHETWTTSGVIDSWTLRQVRIGLFSKTYSDKELTKAYQYEIKNGCVPVHEIHDFHHIKFWLPDEFYLEVKSKEVIKNLAKN
jgi:hypothetical protein